MFHPALLKLIGLQWRGSLRQLYRSLSTIRGMVFFGFITGMALYGLATLYFANLVAFQSPVGGTLTKLQDDFIPLGFFCVTCYVVLFSTGEATIYFSASEASFLFPAPITRKQLLSYTLLKSLIGMLTMSLLFVVYSAPNIGMAIPRLLAALLSLSFLQMLTMNVAFIRHLLEEKMHLQVRRFLGLVIGALILFTLSRSSNWPAATDFMSLFKSIQQSTKHAWILAPFQVFARTLRAPDWINFLPYAGALLIVDALLLQLAYRLDALSLEAALAISEKTTAKLKMMKSKGAAILFFPTNSVAAQRRVPQFPFWAGIGPVLWQRMTTTFRASSRLLWIIFGAAALAAGVVYAVNRDKGNQLAPPIVGIIAMCYLSFLICLMMQHDIERISYLKSLPIRSLSIVIGDLIGFPILISIVQSIFILGLAGFFPVVAPWLLAAAVLTLPFNLLLFGIDKLVFYVYPTRMAKGAPGDFQNSGRQMIFIAIKMLMLGAAALIVGLASLPGALALQSPLVAVVSAVFVLAIECGALVPLLLIAFNRFDPGLAMAS